MKLNLLIPGLEHLEAAPDAARLQAVLERRVIPERPPFLELIVDNEVQAAILQRPIKSIADSVEVFYRLGYDAFPLRVSPTFKRNAVSSHLAGLDQRDWRNSAPGPIQNMSDFESYPWPVPDTITDSLVEDAAAALPEGMALLLRSSGILDNLIWLLGYERLCEALCLERELVGAVAERVGVILYETFLRVLDHPKVLGCFYGDDFGHKTATLIAPEDIREFILTWHCRIAQACHRQGKLMLLHACGQIDALMEDLIEGVRIDGLHSFEDVIESVSSVKQRYGDRVSLIGGVDMDVLAGGTPQQVAEYTRNTLDLCMPGGGYVLGSGNSIASYVPVENYFALLRTGLAYAKRTS